MKTLQQNKKQDGIYNRGNGVSCVKGKSERKKGIESHPITKKKEKIPSKLARPVQHKLVQNKRKLCSRI